MDDGLLIDTTRGRLAVAQVGPRDGSPVVWFHGTPSCRLEGVLDLSEAAERHGLRIVAPDRPGYGGSSFIPYEVGTHPIQVSELIDHLGLDEVTLLGVSGGGRYACAAASTLGSRCRRLVLVSSTASPDLPGVRDSWSRQDRQVYFLAQRLPWLLRLYLRRVATRVGRDPAVVPALFNDDLPPADHDVLRRPEVLDLLASVFSEAFRPGARGAAHDMALESRPWCIDLSGIEAPTDIWHGTDDTIVSILQGEALAASIPNGSLHPLAGEGHLSVRVDRIDEILAHLASSS
jgi:pimeloyl-ACP methyl ester carboxylesterase